MPFVVLTQNIWQCKSNLSKHTTVMSHLILALYQWPLTGLAVHHINHPPSAVLWRGIRGGWRCFKRKWQVDAWVLKLGLPMGACWLLSAWLCCHLPQPFDCQPPNLPTPHSLFHLPSSSTSTPVCPLSPIRLQRPLSSWSWWHLSAER